MSACQRWLPGATCRGEGCPLCWASARTPGGGPPERERRPAPPRLPRDRMEVALRDEALKVRKKAMAASVDACILCGDHSSSPYFTHECMDRANP